MKMFKYYFLLIVLSPTFCLYGMQVSPGKRSCVMDQRMRFVEE